jgi:LuxR family maltose regulon positive regulatory protein
LAWYLGDTATSRELFETVSAHDDLYITWRVHATSALALMEAWEGHLSRAEEHSRTALRLARSYGLEEHTSTLDARLAAAHVHRTRGHFRRAHALLDEVDRTATDLHRPTTLAASTVERAWLHLVTRDPKGGLAAIARYRSSGELTPPPLVLDQLRAVEIRLLLAVGQVHLAQTALAAACEQQSRATRDGDIPTVALQHDLARLAMAVPISVAYRDLARARAALDELAVLRPHDHPSAIDHALWGAILDYEGGHRRQSLRRAAVVAKAASAQRHVTLFSEAGEPGHRLLRALAHADPSPHVLELLGFSTAPRSTTGDVVLSERELEVVRYLPSPMSNAEIAAMLYVSLNTLKTHLRAIYHKLGVQDRRHAIRRAQELGLA